MNRKFFVTVAKVISTIALTAMMFSCSDVDDDDGRYGLNPDNISLGSIGTPSGVTASTQSSSSIRVSWNSVSGASGYNIYRGSSSGGTFSYWTNTSSTSWTNSSLSSNTTYCYRVAAYNSRGDEGSRSSAACATTTSSSSSTSRPGTPSGVTASAQSTSSIRVSWNSVSGATGYYVYRATSSSGSFSYMTSTTSTSWTNTGLSSGTTYWYRVSAYNSAGEGSQSSSASATTQSSSSGGGTTTTGACRLTGYGYTNLCVPATRETCDYYRSLGYTATFTSGGSC